jgi:hypothetical protein
MPPPHCGLHGFLRPIPTTPLGLAPLRQARIHRRRVRTTTSPEPGRLPSDRPRPRGRSGPDCARFSHLHAPAPHPFACRDPVRPRQKGPAVASNYPSRRDEPCGPPRHFRGRCVSPMSATDLRHEHPANRSIPGFAFTSLAACFVRPPAAGATGFTWVEHRLTATLQLRLSTSIRVATRCPGVTPCMARTRYRSVLAGAAIDGPSGGIPRPRCFRPRAELAT